MISSETIATIPVSPWHLDAPFRMGPWLSGGTWAYRGDETILAIAKSERTDSSLGRNLDKLAAFEALLPGIPATEDVALRIPYVADVDDVVKPCRACSGTGDHDCNCDSCEVGCDECDGDGEKVVTEGKKGDPGQRVYRSGDVTTVINERYGLLLEGLVVVRLGDTKTDPLGGVDETGRLIALVMPMLSDVRTPTVAR
jgi:hypothetical protein